MATDWTTATDEQILAADLIIEQGLDTLPAEEQKKILDAMNDAVEQATLTKVLSGLDQPDREQIQQLLSSDDAPAMRSLLMTKAPNFDDVFQQMVILYKRVILTGERPQLNLD